MAWPRGWALAEVLWTGPEQTNWDKFWPRVEQHFVRANAAQINYARSMYNAIITPSYTADGTLEIKLETELGNLDIYYTFDNTDPDAFTPKYSEPAPRAERCHLAACCHVPGRETHREGHHTAYHRIGEAGSQYAARRRQPVTEM